MKVCTVCQLERPLTDFYNLKASKDGKAYRCKSCDDLARNKFRSKHRGRHLKAQRERNWKHKYGIDREDFERMWSEQKGLCKICSIEMTNVEIDGVSKNQSHTCCVDHDHSTGEVRGLLCARCNKGLGLFDDDVERLLRSIEYLNRKL